MKRTKNDHIIGGVCGGLGKYTGIDPIFFRIGFVIIPNTILIYILIWALTSEE
jgi:phage shock protein PspC (stress-responsive transcriptional regulator)